LVSSSGLGFSILADTHTSGAMTIWTAGSEKMRVNSAGSVGIGTTAPGTALQVDASKSNTTVSAPFNSDILRLNNTNATTNALHGILMTRTNGASLTSVGAIMSQVTTQTVGSAAADLLFYTATSDVISERMRITSGGNVGIGTSSPIAKLHIENGNIFMNNSASPYAAGIYNSNSIYLADNQYLDFSTGTFKATSTGASNRLQITYSEGFVFYTSPSVSGGSNVTSNERMRITTAGNVGIGTTSPGCSLDVGSRTDAIHLPNGSTAQRPSSPTAGMGRFNTSTTRTEFYNGTVWVNVGGSGDGSTSSSPATSAKAIKQIVGNPTSGVYWLQIPNVNSGNAFQCYCDFTMDGGVGYAIIFNQYFEGAETGPSHANFASSSITTAGWDTEYQISPTAMISNYGITKLAVFARTGGSASGGITGASYFNWVAFTGPTTTQFNDIFTNGYNSTQFTGSFNSSDGNTGTAYFPNSHGFTGGVTQISTNGGAVNDYILYEYKQGSGTDPNHFWMVANGRVGDVYWVVNNRYGSSTGNVMYNRWGGVAIY
jgi:hypothetical protein